MISKVAPIVSTLGAYFRKSQRTFIIHSPEITIDPKDAQAK